MTEAVDTAFESAPFRWSALKKKLPGAEVSAKEQAREVARALTAHSIIFDREAVIEEFEDRYASIAAIVWGDDPTRGYGLHASLGAFLVAKVAVGMVPAGHTGLRHEPLRRSGIHHVLVDHGLDAVTADSILGDFDAVAPGFKGSRDGLDPSRLAGLAERTLSRHERTLAISQVAYSPRCMQRLAATAGLLAATRAILPMLPPVTLGPDVATAIVAIALGRSDRAIELFGSRTQTLALRTLIELAAAQVALGRGEALVLDDDAFILAPPTEEALAPHEADDQLDGEGHTDIVDDAFDTSGASDDEDDVLEIVEERVDPDSGVLESKKPHGAPRPARWGVTDEPLSESRLLQWRNAVLDGATIASKHHVVLGLTPAPTAATVAALPMPPDERVIRRAMIENDEDSTSEKTERIDLAAIMAEQQIALDGTPYDALFPAARGLLRTIASAADGRAPSAKSLTQSGDLEWIVRRARALALVARGDLVEARDVVSALGDEAAPEGRWAKDRLIRFENETPEPVSPAEARPAAAALVEDLAHQLARTIAVTIPGITFERDGADG